MKKELTYLIELLSKNAKNEERLFFEKIILFLENKLLYAPSSYSEEKIKTLMQYNGYSVPKDYKNTLSRLDLLLTKLLSSSINEGKKQLLMTLLYSNFPSKKGLIQHSLALFESQLEPVEKNIYANLNAYIEGLNRALGIYCILSEQSTPETLIAFGETLHVTLVSMIYNEEEKALLDKGLHELLAVYLTLYGKYLYV